jgi:hypothetical protein
MPKKPKIVEEEPKGTWAEDQEKREYYYDDAHGYEDFDPEEGEDEEEMPAEDDHARP